MNRTEPLFDFPSPSRQPERIAESPGVVDTTAPPDMEAFKNVRSFGFKGLKEKLEAKRREG